MNGDVKCGLSNLEFNNGEQLEYFHSRILGLQQEIILSIETVSPTRLIFHYIKELSNINKLKAFIATNMTVLIKLSDKNGKLAV